MKIVVLDGYAGNPGDLSWDAMQALGDLTVWDRTDDNQILERCRGAQAVLTNKVALTADILAALHPTLQYVGILATGTNVVDLAAAHRYGIAVTNVPAYSTDSVAQIAIAHLLNITNRVQRYTNEVRDGRWSSSKDFCFISTPILELSGRLMGLVGLGNIGMAVARIALAMGMRVQAVTSKNQDQLPQGIVKCDLDTLFATSDVVSLHCPLTPETRGMVNRRRLHAMKAHAILINTARGGLVVDDDLADVLNKGGLLGAGIDVMDPEPPTPDNPLLTARHCYFTPHIGWASKEARIRLMDVSVANLAAWQQGQPVNLV